MYSLSDPLQNQHKKNTRELRENNGQTPFMKKKKRFVE